MKNKKILIGVVGVIVIIIVAIIIINSIDYKNKTITEKNYETIFKEAENANLTDEEKAQLATGTFKYVFNPSAMYGKKIKDIIEEGKNLIGNEGNANSKKDNSTNEDKRTMEEFVKAYQDNGCNIDLNEKPFFTMIGASDGIIFYLDNSPVKIYKYNSESSYNEAKKNNGLLENWERNGLFVLETNSEKAKEIFKTIK